jgi:hypothetical protein
MYVRGVVRSCACHNNMLLFLNHMCERYLMCVRHARACTTESSACVCVCADYETQCGSLLSRVRSVIVHEHAIPEGRKKNDIRLGNFKRSTLRKYMHVYWHMMRVRSGLVRARAS